jgi:hypothetical protein
VLNVHCNPNIQYAFPITTPFPGSSLYEFIFQQRLLKDQQEFYDKYISSTDTFEQVVNLSRMSNKEVLEMQKKIGKAYREEQSRALGLQVIMFNKSRKIIGRIHIRLTYMLISKIASCSYLNFISKTYNLAWDFIQIRLEQAELKLRRIYKSTGKIMIL